MGGALSEPSTLVDLQESIRLLCDKSASANELDRVLPGMSKHNLKFDRSVQGLQHVDDAGVFSKILCPSCLLKIVTNLWPHDVGITLEEQGPVMRFLSGILHV